MKKNIIIIISAIVIIAIACILFVTLMPKEEKKEETLTEISLSTESRIKSLQNIKIKGTNDYFRITESVKWEAPKTENGETVSFFMSIPYKIVVDGNEYDGTYELNNYSSTKYDENPKYDLRIIDLTEDETLIVKVNER